DFAVEPDPHSGQAALEKMRRGGSRRISPSCPGLLTPKRTGPPGSALVGLSSFMEARTTVVWLRQLRAASAVVWFRLRGAWFSVPCGSCGVSDAARCGLFVASSVVPCDLYDVPDGAPCRSSRRTVLKRVTVLGRLTVLGPQHPMR